MNHCTITFFSCNPISSFESLFFPSYLIVSLFPARWALTSVIPFRLLMVSKLCNVHSYVVERDWNCSVHSLFFSGRVSTFQERIWEQGTIEQENEWILWKKIQMQSYIPMDTICRNNSKIPHNQRRRWFVCCLGGHSKFASQKPLVNIMPESNTA